MDEVVPQRTAAYISQHDVHIGEMTVRETLSFSARCQGVGPQYEMVTELSGREEAANNKPDPNLDVFMKANSMPGKEASVITDYTLKIVRFPVSHSSRISHWFLHLSPKMNSSAGSQGMLG